METNHIATDRFWHKPVDADGQWVDLFLWSPYFSPVENGGVWKCKVEISGQVLPASELVAESSLQALCLAISIAIGRIGSSSGGTFYHEPEDDEPIDAGTYLIIPIAR